MESSGPSQSEKDFKAPKSAAEAATDAAMGQMQQETFNDKPEETPTDQRRGTTAAENRRNDLNKAKKLFRAARNFFGGRRNESQFDNHGDSGASETRGEAAIMGGTTTLTEQAQEQAQFRQDTPATNEATVVDPDQARADQQRRFAETEAAAAARATEAQAARLPDPEPTPPLPGATRGRDAVAGDGGQMLDDIAAAGVDMPGGRQTDADPQRTAGTDGDTPVGRNLPGGPMHNLETHAGEQAVRLDELAQPGEAPAGTDAIPLGPPAENATQTPPDAEGVQALAIPDRPLPPGVVEGEFRELTAAAQTAIDTRPETDLARTAGPLAIPEQRGLVPDGAMERPGPNTYTILDQDQLPPGPEQQALPADQAETPQDDHDLLRSQFPGAEVDDPDNGNRAPEGDDAPPNAETPLDPNTNPDGEGPATPEDPNAREREDAEIARLTQELGLKRDEYIKAREITRSFWRNLVGNIVAFGTAEIKSPAAYREAKRTEYEAARNALIKLQAETEAKRKGLSVPDMPAPLAEGATDDEREAHAASVTKAEEDKKKYDQEILSTAINLITAEKYELAKEDFENMNRSNAVARALERLAKNPTVRLAVAGGLLASTATGFLPGVAAFGAAQAGLSVVGMKGALDFGAEQWAGKFGDERKNLSTEQLMKMDQDERDRRDAALLEMGIKRNQNPEQAKNGVITNAEQKNDAMSQERIQVAVQKMRERGEISGNTPQERAASVLNAILKEGNLNGAIDSKIDKNRRWNAVRWVAALGGAAAFSGLEMPGASATEVQPDAVTSVPETPTPTIETTSVTPWEHASGHGYSWTGWQEGQIRDFLKMSPDFQGEADVQNWINTHPTEYAHAKNAIIEAMQQANPGVDVAGEGVLGQEYKVPTNLKTVIEQAIRSGSNVS